MEAIQPGDERILLRLRLLLCTLSALGAFGTVSVDRAIMGALLTVPFAGALPCISVPANNVVDAIIDRSANEVEGFVGEDAVFRHVALGDDANERSLGPGDRNGSFDFG